MSDRTTEHSKAVTAHVEDLSRRLLHCITANDLSHPDFKGLMDTNFVAYLEHSDTPFVASKNDFVKYRHNMAKKFPEYHAEEISILADVDEAHGLATVWMLLKITGHGESVQRESLTIGYWKRRKGKWIAYKQTGFRGGGGNM